MINVMTKTKLYKRERNGGSRDELTTEPSEGQETNVMDGECFRRVPLPSHG